jgi:hypothetical protein
MYFWKPDLVCRICSFRAEEKTKRKTSMKHVESSPLSFLPKYRLIFMGLSRRFVWQDSTFRKHRYENLKFYTMLVVCTALLRGLTCRSIYYYILRIHALLQHKRYNPVSIHDALLSP